jgi:hypothetical protein
VAIPNIKGVAYKDSDKDGIPDDWEKKNGLNPDNATDASQKAKDNSGYTNIEEYLSNIAGDNKKGF